MKTKLRWFGLVFCLTLVTAACAGDDQDGAAGGAETEEAGTEDATEEEAADGEPGGVALPEGYGEETLDWTIAFGPGGGNDIMSRELIEIIQQYELYPGNITAENREGGSGATGWGYLLNQAGNPYAISSTSGSFLTTPLQADTGWVATDFTPVGLMATDELVLLVNDSSPITTLEEFVEAAQADPPSIGGIGIVNVDFIVPSLFATQADFEFEYVSFNAAGELNTALLSESLDAIVSNPGELLGQIQSGDLRALAFTGAERLEELGDTPTFAELDYEIGVSLPRGIVLPPDVDPEIQEYWISVMQEVAETPEWQEYIEDNLLSENLAWDEDFTAFLEDTGGTFETILREQGAIE